MLFKRAFYCGKEGYVMDIEGIGRARPHKKYRTSLHYLKKLTPKIREKIFEALSQ